MTSDAIVLRSAPRANLLRFAVAAGAVLAVAAGFALLFGLFASAAPPPPARAPFGMGVREAAPSASGIGGMLLAIQSSFFASLRGAVLALKEGGSAFGSLAALGFAYGVFHAAGPGHGKAVIAAYLVADDRALMRGFALSLAAALLQAVVAIAIVVAAAVILGATAQQMGRATNVIEIVSFAAVTALGVLVTWRKAGAFLGLVAITRGAAPGSAAPACDHVHLPPPAALDRMTRFRELAGVVVAAGLRPCAGALVVLVFALSQGLFAAGIAATFAMALGTAITTGVIAALAVFGKRLALRLAGGRGAFGTLAVGGLELLAAAFVLVVGLALLTGVWLTSAGA